MNRLISTLAVAGAVLAADSIAFAEKKELDHDVYDSWQSVSNVAMSDDGKIILWQVNPQEGDGELLIRNSKVYGKKSRTKKEEAREIRIPRGYSASLDPDGNWVYCRIKPEFAKTRQEKIDKKKKEEMTQDSLAVIDLKTMTIKKFGVVESFTTAAESKSLVAYKSYWMEKAAPEASKPEPAADKNEAAVSDVPDGSKPQGETKQKEAEKKETKKPGEIKSGIIVLDPLSGRADTLMNVDTYNFERSGNFLALVSKKDAKKKGSENAVILARPVLAGDASDKLLVLDTLAKGAKAYKTTVFSDKPGEMLFMASNDSSKNRNKEYSLSLVSFTHDLKAGTSYESEVREIVGQGTKVDGTPGWTLNENCGAWFTPDGRRIVTAIAPITPPKDSTIVDFETARVDIWNWDSPYTPPQQKTRLSSTQKKTYTAVIDLRDASNATGSPTDSQRRIVPLTSSPFTRIVFLDGAASDWALAMDNGKYIRTSVWDYKNLYDVSLVNLTDGSTKPIATAIDAGAYSVSPKGKYFLWFDNGDLQWHSYCVETGVRANLTEGTGVKFYNEEDDHPTTPSPYDSSPKWIEGDQAVLIADRYDIWKFSPDGSSATVLTSGTGRAGRNRFRAVFLDSKRLTDNQRKAGVARSFGAKETIHLTVFNEETMENGLGRMDLSKPRNFEFFTDTVKFASLSKASADNRVFFTKGNFRNPYDLHITDDFFKSETRLTSINPQMDDYRWGRAELFEWKAYDGTPLKGLVFVPDGVKADEKLPVMIYFYEKYSESLYSFWTPAPSRSTVNIPFYTSRGYLVFIPDIVYKVGHPGESAWNCICSGAEALCEKYSFADKSRMGIQGQSWGGYQTAYLVTRTNMFAAAGSGAPVGNMTSAYGGIRWESGMTRAGQYEHGQSRIGASLWDEGGLALYIENSPVFHVDKVSTPVLIMHNDNDGAVPWYQGIEFFSNLRRLDKPSWLLQYNNEAHNLVERRNCKDLSKRLQQFFDHYLKGAPMPAWMKNGVPMERKGEYFGFENAE